AGGVGFDIAARHGVASVAATAWIGVCALSLLCTGRIRGLAGRALVCPAPPFGLLLVFLARALVNVPPGGAGAGRLVVGGSRGADGGVPADSFSALATRVWFVLGHLGLAPAMFVPSGDNTAAGVALRRAPAVVRGLALGVPVAFVLGLLLAWADPIFRSWFDLTALANHILLGAIGAWLLTGLSRAASAREPLPKLISAPGLGTIEAVLILGGLCGLYLAFVAAQFVALSDGGHHVLVTHGLTYAQYARNGFFQLLACAAITLLVLLAVRACTLPDNRVIASLSWLT